MTKRVLRRVAIGIVTAVVAGVLIAPPAHADQWFAFVRIAGDDRYSTAAAVAREVGDTTERALLATGESYSDALAAAHLAGARSAPILLTATDALPSATVSALDDLGVESVTLLGGTGAISTAVEAELRATGYDVGRIAGADRYETARLVAEAAGAGAVGLAGDRRTAIVAGGAGFADAIAAGPLAYAVGLPTLLTERDRLSPPAAAAIDSLGIEQALVLGGTGAVSTAVEDQLTGIGVEVVRLAGANRLATAVAVADYAVDVLGFAAEQVTLARGDGFADALTGAVLGGNAGAVTLLTSSPESLGSATATWLADHAATLAGGVILGGPGAVSASVEAAATDAAGASGGDTAAAAVKPMIDVTGGLVDGAVTTDTTPVWSGVASADEGDVRRVSVSLDGGDASTTGVDCDGCGSGDVTWEYEPLEALAEGTHTIELRAVGDTATSAPASVTVTVDTVAPALNAITVARDSNRVGVTFSEPMLCTTVGAADFIMRVNGAVVAVTGLTCAAPSSSAIELVLGRTLVSNDAVALELVGSVTDRAGHRAPPGHADAVVENADAPGIVVTAGPGDGAHAWDRPRFDGTGEAPSGRSVAAIEARIGSATFSATDVTCTGCPGTEVSWWYRPSATLGVDGVYTISFRVRDDAGVFSDTVTRTFTKDTVAPAFTSIAATAASPAVSATFTEVNGLDCATVAASDFTATIATVATAVASVSCAAPTSSVVEVTLATAPTAGQSVALTLKAYAVSDRAGNAGEPNPRVRSDPA